MALAPEDLRTRRAPLADADLHTTWRVRAEPLFAPPWSWYGATELVQAGQAALERCVGNAERFRVEHWGQRPFVAPGRPEGYTDLIDLDVIDHLLATRPLRDPTLQLLRRGVPLRPASLGAGDGSYQADGVIEVARAVAELADGATLVINNVQDLWPALGNFCDLLSVGLGHRATADVHLSTGRAPGLVEHVAVDDAMVLQVAGTAHWTVAGWALDPGQAPEREWTDLTGGLMVLETELSAGQCLAVPRGFTCSSMAGTGPSLDLVVWTDGRPWGSTAPEGPGERSWSGSARPVEGGLIDAMSAGAVTAESVVRRRPGSVAWMRVAEDRLVLRTDRREISAPAWIRSWVDQLLGGPLLTAGDLASPHLVPDALVLVKRLLREGLLTQE